MQAIRVTVTASEMAKNFVSYYGLETAACV